MTMLKGREVSLYLGGGVDPFDHGIIDLMRAAYTGWPMISIRAESPVKDTLAWQVIVGVSREVMEPDGALGLNLMLECAATVRFVSKGQFTDDSTHGFLAIDIANSLAAWLANTVDSEYGVIPRDIEVAVEPVNVRVSGQDINTGRYIAHVFWTVKLNRLDPDIDIPDWITGHPARKRVVDLYYYEIEEMDGSKYIVKGGEELPPAPDGGFVKRIRFIFDDRLSPPYPYPLFKNPDGSFTETDPTMPDHFVDPPFDPLTEVAYTISVPAIEVPMEDE